MEGYRDWEHIGIPRDEAETRLHDGTKGTLICVIHKVMAEK